MNIVLMVAILALSTTAVHAQDQPDVAKLKAEAEDVVKIISGDKRHYLQASKCGHNCLVGERKREGLRDENRRGK
jgi:hypothetical protein